MEPVRNIMNLHLTTDHANAVKWFSKPECKSNTHANILFLIETHRAKLVDDEPVYVGCAVLDLSKLHMLDLHNNVIYKQFGDRAKLIYSDTDSFVYELEHPNTYDCIHNNEQYFDSSKSERPEIKCNDDENGLGLFQR